MGLNELRDAVYKNAYDHGFYEIDSSMLNKINIQEKLMRAVSELGEASEAHSKGHYADLIGFEKAMADSDRFNPDKKEMYSVGPFQIYIKDSLEDEIADAIIRLLDICGFMNIDIEKHIALKMQYNAGRPYKHGKIC